MPAQIADRATPRRTPLRVMLALVGWAMILAAGLLATLAIFLVLMQPDDPQPWGAVALAAVVATIGCLMTFYRRR